jgi:hypothetical protein
MNCYNIIRYCSYNIFQKKCCSIIHLRMNLSRTIKIKHLRLIATVVPFATTEDPERGIL